MFILKDKTIQSTLDTLNQFGESAVFGGYIRDCLLNLEPNDIDIVTTTSTEKIVELFPDCKFRKTLSGFTIISFHKHRKQFEVAADAENIIDKSFKADLNINSLLYDGEKLIDPTNSLPDFNAGIIRSTNGLFEEFVNVSPFLWYKPLRLCATTGFALEESLIQSLSNSSSALPKINQSISIQEGYKILESINPHNALFYLSKLGILSDFTFKEDFHSEKWLKIGRSYESHLAYLACITNEKLITEFIRFFSFPEPLLLRFQELMQVLNGKPTDDFKLMNQKILFDRLFHIKKSH